MCEEALWPLFTSEPMSSLLFSLGNRHMHKHLRPCCLLMLAFPSPFLEAIEYPVCIDARGKVRTLTEVHHVGKHRDTKKTHEQDPGDILSG